MKKKTNKTKLYTIVGIIVVVIGLIISFSVQKYGGNFYKIATIVPITGAGANLGTPMANGMNLAIEDVNSKGGINGYKVKLIVQDGKLEGKASADAANYLLNIENPDIFTVLFHLPAQAVSPILKKAKKPMVYEAYTRSMLNNNPYAFKANFDSLTGCEKLVKYAKEHGRYHKLGVIMSRTEYNQLCLEGIKKVEPNVKEYWYNFGEKDFRTLFAKAKDDGIDTLMTIGIDFEYINMFKQLTELGYPIKMMCATASECIFPEVIESSSPSVLNGTLSIDFVPVNIDKTEFADEYKSKYPNPSFTDYVYGAVGYEEVMYITEAMKNCNPGDSNCLTEQLKKVKGYKTILGSNGFKDRVLQLTTRIYEFRDGKWNLLE